MGKRDPYCRFPVAIEDEALKQAVIQHMQTSAYQVSLQDKFIYVRDKQSKKPKLVNVIVAN